MSSISKVDLILQSLRAEAFAGRKPTTRLHKAAEKPSADRQRVSAAAAHAANRIGAIAADDPQKRQHAFRFFLEANVIGLFGADAVTDPAFGDLIDKVNAAMSSHPEINSAIEKITDNLLGGRDGSASMSDLSAVFPTNRRMVG